jgi:hypothetical protein
MGLQNVDWIHLAQDRYVNTIGFHKMWGILD